MDMREQFLIKQSLFVFMLTISCCSLAADTDRERLFREIHHAQSKWSDCEFLYSTQSTSDSESASEKARFDGAFLGYEAWSGSGFIVANEKASKEAMQQLANRPHDPKLFQSIYITNNRYQATLSKNEQEGFALSGLFRLDSKILETENTVRELFRPDVDTWTTDPDLQIQEVGSARFKEIECDRIVLKKTLVEQGETTYQQHEFYFDRSSHGCVGHVVRYADDGNFEQAENTDRYAIDYSNDATNPRPIKITRERNGRYQFVQTYDLIKLRSSELPRSAFYLPYYGIQEPKELRNDFPMWFVLVLIGIIASVASIGWKGVRAIRRAKGAAANKALS